MIQPDLSPKLVAKLKSLDLGAIADLLLPIPEGMSRIHGAEAPDTEDVVSIPEPEPVWPVEPMAKKEDSLYKFVVSSRKKRMHQGYVFLATIDWKNLAVPTALLSPDHLPDPVLRKWHWWRGKGAETTGTEQATVKLAKAIVYDCDGISYDPDNPESLRIMFDVETPKGKHVFMTYHGWRGLWAPIYMTDEDVVPDAAKRDFYKELSESKIQGRKAVRKYAMGMAQKFDRLEYRLRKRRSQGAGRYVVTLNRDRAAKLVRFRDWVATENPNGCTQNEAIGRALDLAAATIPSEEELPPGFMRQLSRRDRVMGAAKELFAAKKPISATAIARMLNYPKARVSVTIGVLKAEGIWPYQTLRDRRWSKTPRTRVDKESKITQRILGELCKVGTEVSRLRILDRVLDGVADPKTAMFTVDHPLTYYGPKSFAPDPEI